MTQFLSPKQLLKRYNIRPSKKLGQNFLIDKNVLKKIIEAAELPDSPARLAAERAGGYLKDIVLEIGPGLGILTIELAKRAKKVITIEKDKKMCEILSHVLSIENVKNVEIINADILKIVNCKLKIGKLVANLPYYITSPVIRKFLEAKQKPELMVLMVQKEVAQRICSQPPRMNLLAVAVQFYAHPVRNKISNGAGPEIISYVSKKSFYPQPKVDSAIIKIVPRKSALLPASVRNKFFEFVKAGFSSKRKMLINNLYNKFQISKSKIQNLLKELGINPKIRAENLSIEEWLKLYEILHSR